MAKWRRRISVIALLISLSLLSNLPSQAAGNSNSATPGSTVEKTKKDSGAKTTPDPTSTPQITPQVTVQSTPSAKPVETQTPIVKEKKAEPTPIVEVKSTKSPEPTNEARVAKEAKPVESKATKESKPAEVKATKESKPAEVKATKESKPAEVKATKEPKKEEIKKKKAVEVEKKGVKSGIKPKAKVEESKKSKASQLNPNSARSDGVKPSEKSVVKSDLGDSSSSKPEPTLATTSSPATQAVRSAPSPVATPDASLDHFVRIEKSEGNKATLVVSGPKVGTKIKITITSKATAK